MKMKINLRWLLIIVTLAFPSLVRGQQTPGFTIVGHINGLKDGTAMVLKMMVYDNPLNADLRPVDTTYVKNGEFRINGHVPEGPRFYWLHFQVDSKNAYLLRLFLDNDQHITVRYDKEISKIRFELLDNCVTVEGSPTNYAWHLIWKIDDALSVSLGGVNDMLKKVKDSLGYNKDIVSAIMNVKSRNIARFDNQNLNFLAPDVLPGVPLLAAYEGQNHDLAWDKVYDQMDEHLRNSALGKQMKERLPLLVGKELPGFTLPDVNNKPFNLKNLVSKNKLTLVHFWATNSAERQDYDKDLRAMYKLYHDKGLNIVGVSSEAYEDQWKETLSKENYPWLNLFDKKGQAVVDPVYHEYGAVGKENTTNVLLNAEGKIIAWDPAGIELQYYISKALGE
jgi:peroxiredoxin